MRLMGISSVRAKALSPAVRQFLQQPTAISAIASLGIHALVFALLPILPYAALVEEKEPDIRQSVEVVELSPEEQARLPEFPTSQIDLPPLLDSLPSAVTDLPPLPVPNQSTSPPSADDLFSDPFFTSSLPNFSIPTLPQTVPYPPVPPVQPRPQQQPIVVQPLTPQGQPESSPDDTNGELPSLPEGYGELLNPPLEQSGSERTPENGDVATNNDTASPQPSPAPQSPAAQPRSDEEIVAALNQDVEARRRQIAIERQLSRDPVGTAADPNYNPGTSWTAWTAQLEGEFGVNLENIDPDAKTEIAATFPPEVCEFVSRLDPELVRQGISADFGVVVDPDGKPIGGLSVLRSSGYTFFNNKGGEAVLSHESYENKTGKNVPYLVTVVFPYTGDSCPDNTGQATASPTP